MARLRFLRIIFQSDVIAVRRTRYVVHLKDKCVRFRFVRQHVEYRLVYLDK